MEEADYRAMQDAEAEAEWRENDFYNNKPKKMSDKVFAEGMIVKTITTKYGELDKISIKVEEFKEFLDKYDNNGWVNINIKTSQWSGKKYAELDTWSPEWGSKPKEDNSWSHISIEDIEF